MPRSPCRESPCAREFAVEARREEDEAHAHVEDGARGYLAQNLVGVGHDDDAGDSGRERRRESPELRVPQLEDHQIGSPCQYVEEDADVQQGCPRHPFLTQIITNHESVGICDSGAVGAKVLALPPPCPKPCAEGFVRHYFAQFGLIFKTDLERRIFRVEGAARTPDQGVALPD